ncbi:MAG: hypothetical protein AB4080_10625 [Trichodesmium sp.]
MKSGKVLTLTLMWGLLTTFFPQIAKAERPAWGSGSGWQRVSTKRRAECELAAERKLKEYETAGKLQKGTVRRIAGTGAEGRMAGKDAMFAVICAPEGDAVYVFDVCPDRVCRERPVIDLRNELGQAVFW